MLVSLFIELVNSGAIKDIAYLCCFCGVENPYISLQWVPSLTSSFRLPRCNFTKCVLRSTGLIVEKIFVKTLLDLYQEIDLALTACAALKANQCLDLGGLANNQHNMDSRVSSK